MSSDYIIIIGAGRSGTNALRDALCKLDEFGTWPCDEINYVWRYGNRSHPTDELTPSDATEQTKRFIRTQFRRQQQNLGTHYLVEKTCANSLRVGFVNEVLPEARFINIVRDGRDVAVSAAQRWTAPLDLPYLARKARYVPKRDLPFYASRYLRTRLDRLRSDERRLSWWGPKFAGMEDLDAETPLLEVAARQWAASVLTADEQLADIPRERVLNIRYEDFVSAPFETLDQITRWIGARPSVDQLTAAAAGIHGRSVGSWASKLADADERELVDSTTANARAALGLGDG